MDDVDEYIRNDQSVQRLNGNSTAIPGSLRPSLPVRLNQPSRETVQEPDRERHTARRVSHFREEVAFVAPVTSTSRACVGADMFNYPSNEPYRVMVEEPVKCRSEVVALVQVASTSGACAGAATVSRQHSNGATLEIVEQPLQRRRFRYDSDIRSAGPIQGAQSMKGHKSFPKIKIGNYAGPAEITVSLVCKDKPYRVHPNGIVGKMKSSLPFIYVKQVQVIRSKSVIQFADLAIRIVRTDQIEEALRLREDQNVDPFGQGFSHKFDLTSDDLHAVRLCFQVKLAQEHKLDPVVSDIICHFRPRVDYKISTLGCLEINKVIMASNTSDLKAIFYSQPQQLNPKDVEVVFYEEENGEVVWEHCVRQFDISDTSGFVCAVPPYTRATIDCDIEVNVVLRRLSDGTYGDPKPFTYFADTDWTPPASLPPENDTQYDQDWRNIPGPFDDNSGVSGLNHVKSAVPEPGFVNSAVPESGSVNSALTELGFVKSAVPEPGFVNSAVPEQSFVNSALTELGFINSALPELGFVNSALPELGFVNSAVPEPGFVNLAVPEPTEWGPMQRNLSISPDIVPVPCISQPVSVTEDEGFFSPNGLDNDSENYSGEDSALADVENTVIMVL